MDLLQKLLSFKKIKELEAVETTNSSTVSKFNGDTEMI